MASGCRCFVLNRSSDWKDKSVLKNLLFKNDVLVSKCKSGENGVYISGAFDSMQHENTWNRLTIDSSLPQSALYKLRVYVSDTSEISIPIPGKKGRSKVDINEYISDKKIDINHKIDMFDSIGAKTYYSPTDILLYEFTGRYMWICLEIINYEEENVEVKEVKIEFPRISFVDYLPEVYREDGNPNSFLAKFVGIFQSMYLGVENSIDYTPIKFDVDRTSNDLLDWMADWLSIRDTSLWGEKRLRKLIKKAVKIYKMKGTKRAVSKIVKEYCGIEPIIVEQFDVKENMYYDKQKEVVENLFGDNGYVFTVVLPQDYVKDTEEYIELLRVINEVKPVDSICNLALLTNQIYLDCHCYIGINSYIVKNEKLILDSQKSEGNFLMIVNS